MRLLSVACLLIASMITASAGAATDSNACRVALQALQVQEDRVVAARGQSDAKALRGAQARLQQRRHDTALACLGGRADAPPPATIARPPVVVTAPPPPAVPLPRSSTVAPSSIAVPARPEPQVFITGCDASGCWASNGAHLPRTGGGGVLTPQGPCTVQGTVLSCAGAR